MEKLKIKISKIIFTLHTGWSSRIGSNQQRQHAARESAARRRRHRPPHRRTTNLLCAEKNYLWFFPSHLNFFLSRSRRIGLGRQRQVPLGHRQGRGRRRGQEHALFVFIIDFSIFKNFPFSKILIKNFQKIAVYMPEGLFYIVISGALLLSVGMSLSQDLMHSRKI